MSIVAPTFSESWHRVAGVKASLRPTVDVRRQTFRGENWYVLQDAFNNQFFRLRPAAYEFVARLRPDKTIEEVWHEVLEHDPENAPGQEEAIRLLTQLHFANLLFYDTPSDSEQFFERYSQRKQRELKSKLMAIMFIRLPLFDPDNVLRKTQPYTRFFFTWFAAAVWLFVVGWALKVVVDNFDEVLNQAEGVLAPSNLALLYLGMVVIKSLHEIGHAVTCRHFGGEVHTLGVMLLVFTPLPYMDATSSWSFRSRPQRILVGAAGMIVEIFIAGLAVFVWAATGDGIVHSVAYNMMFVASISTVIFNANPLLKFDGYYILSDLADMPNLYTRSRSHWAYLFEKYLYGVKKAIQVADSRREATWLTCYGALSGAYRIIVFTGIIIFVADKYLLLGLLMVAILMVAWVLVPPYKLIKYLATSPKLDRTRTRAVGATAGIIAALLIVTAIIPIPNRFRAPGIVEATEFTKVTNKAGGLLEEVLVQSGKPVEAGMPLARLSDWEINNDIRALQAQMRQAQATAQWSTSQGSGDVRAVRQRQAVIQQQLSDLADQRDSLTVRARQSGVWVTMGLEQQLGSWVARGTEMGLVYDPDAFQFKAVIPQDEASNLFEDEFQLSEIRLLGRESINIEVDNIKVIPFQSDQLPSAALSWLAGGEIRTARDDESGLQATEPFFLLEADIPPDAGLEPFHGQSGRMRISLESKPLLWQVYREVRQLLQERYQI